MAAFAHATMPSTENGFGTKLTTTTNKADYVRITSYVIGTSSQGTTVTGLLRGSCLTSVAGVAQAIILTAYRKAQSHRI